MDVFAGQGSQEPPLVQLCIDVRTLQEATAVAEMGLRAGVDWLELGTPLIAWVGINSLEPFTTRFSGTVKFLDAKVMDGSRRYVESADKLGIQLVCLCASASDATFRAAISDAAQCDVRVVADLYAVPNPVARAQELADLGVNAIYLHYGLDEHNESPEGDPTLEQLVQLRRSIQLPIGIVTADTESGERAAREGADVVLVSHPFLTGPDAEPLLTDYVRRVKAAAVT